MMELEIIQHWLDQYGDHENYWGMIDKDKKNPHLYSVSASVDEINTVGIGTTVINAIFDFYVQIEKRRNK